MRALGIVALVHALPHVAGAAVGALQGQEVHCIRSRAHLLTYDVAGEPNDGTSWDGIDRAVISLRPSTEHAEHCMDKSNGTASGKDRQFCYGVNEDSTCDGAKAVLPIKDGFECKDCFLSAGADAFYEVNYSRFHLNSLEVGLRDIELRASASIHRHWAESGTVAKGTLELPGSNRTHTLINVLVGCPICVRVAIRVAVPTTLSYDLSDTGRADFQAGAVATVNLGDNTVRYEHGSGWTHKSQKPQVSTKPILTADPKVEADLSLSAKTSLEVRLDNIAWYHFDMGPSFPLTLRTHRGHTSEGKRTGVCLDGNASFALTQEADLDWKLFAWHAKAHWGPKQIHSWSRKDIVHECRDVMESKTPLLVV